MKTLVKTLAAVTFIISMTSNVNAKSNALFTLENLERQRAILLDNFTTTKLGAFQRERQTNKLNKGLVDMERMVLRDDRIAASNSIMAKKAFQNYDLTFLIHAGSESKKSVMAHWLNSLNISNESIAKSKAGAR